MKKVLLVFALFLILVFGMVFAQNYLKTKQIFPFKENPTAIINEHAFELTIADSDKERQIGLSETKSLSENQGMLFLFEKPGYYSFWMKNMKIAIDIIYINDQNIVSIQHNAQPPTNLTESPIIYTPAGPSDKVLEINSGLAEKYNFKIGDRVKYENLSN